MWVDYAVYLTTGLVLVAAIVLIVVVVRNRARSLVVITLIALVFVGLAGLVLVGPERSREMGEDLVVAEENGRLQTEVELIGSASPSSAGSGPFPSSWATTSSW